VNDGNARLDGLVGAEQLAGAAAVALDGERVDLPLNRAAPH
jgi:hypothetical protein